MNSMLIHHFLESSAARYPAKTAVVHDDHRMTYRELDAQASRLASHLRANGIAKGDRVALLLENGIDYIVAYYATLKAGAVAAPLNPGLKPDGLQFLLNDLEPATIITGFRSERLLKAVSLSAIDTLKLVVIRNPKQNWSPSGINITSFAEVETETQALPPVIDLKKDDLASIIYTSGSTGKPKGVMLSHQNIESNTRSICQYLSLTQNDIQMVVLPFFYVMGKSLLNTHMAVGGTVVINNRFMYPADVVNQMIAEKVTAFSGVPSTYAYLLNRSPLPNCRDKLPHLRYCSQAGGHMAKSLKVELRKVLPAHTQIVIMYGATEASARLTYLEPPLFQSKIESIGKPIPGVSIRILDNNGHDAAQGREGELVASGANIMMGYWRSSEDTRRVLSDKGYHTGDIGYRDTDGFLYVVRRKDGLLKVGGHRVNPNEIEDYLMDSRMVVEAAVVGIPDQMLGTSLVGIVVPKDDDSPLEALKSHCAKGLPNHKCPARIITTRALPKKASGKIDLDKCVQMAKAQ